ncbi:MAG TPA: hypothetical protein VLA68_05665 [Nitrososphaera sp.]|nr:hypothetical protein [Nitrososphaera sp.]
MQDENKIPRWILENDPAWEKSVDSNLGLLRWTKRGTGIQAICSPTSMYCEILGKDENTPGLADVRSGASKITKQGTAGAGEIRKYLSSAYLNPGINGPRFDLRRDRRV